MAIKLSSKSQDDIPTLTEVVTENEDAADLSQAKPSSEGKSTPGNSFAGHPLPPKFERVLEKIIYKKLHPQLVATSQTLAAEIMAELQRHWQANNKADKNQN